MRPYPELADLHSLYPRPPYPVRGALRALAPPPPKLNRDSLPTPPSTSIFVCNIPPAFSSARLLSLFSRTDKPLGADIARATTASEKIFGFVYFRTLPEARRAIRDTHGYRIAGEKLLVTYARSNSQKQTATPPRPVPTPRRNTAPPPRSLPTNPPAEPPKPLPRNCSIHPNGSSPPTSEEH